MDAPRWKKSRNTSIKIRGKIETQKAESKKGCECVPGQVCAWRRIQYIFFHTKEFFHIVVSFDLK